MVRAVAAASNWSFCATNSFASFNIAGSSSKDTPFAGLEMPQVALQSRIMMRSFFQLSFFALLQVRICAAVPEQSSFWLTISTEPFSSGSRT